MNKYWIAIIVVLAVVGWIAYKAYNAPEKKKRISGQDADAGVKKWAEGTSPKRQAIADEKNETQCADGQTLANIDKGLDYKRTETKYYLNYFGCGDNEIEQVEASAYNRFITDYPNGIAAGNVIFKYAKAQWTTQ